MVTSLSIHCKFCYSRNVIKYGTRKNVQRFWCKDCRRKFVNNYALPGMKIAFNITEAAVGSYFEGISANIIIQEILNKYRLYVSINSIFEWVRKFSYLGSEVCKQHHPDVGDTWIVNETKANICDSDYFFIDIIDTETQFVIATKFYSHIGFDGFYPIIESVKDQVGKMPKDIIILSSRNKLNLNKIKDHIRQNGIDILVLNAENKRKLRMQLTGSCLTRNRILSRLKNKDNINKIINGWLMYYNYSRKNWFLHGKTPSQMANIEFNLSLLPS